MTRELSWVRRTPRQSCAPSYGPAAKGCDHFRRCPATEVVRHSRSITMAMSSATPREPRARWQFSGRVTARLSGSGRYQMVLPAGRSRSITRGRLSAGPGARQASGRFCGARAMASATSAHCPATRKVTRWTSTIRVTSWGPRLVVTATPPRFFGRPRPEWSGSNAARRQLQPRHRHQQ